MKWTLVQHSGYGYAGDEQFKHAVETRMLTKRQEIVAVEKAGGLLFDSYLDACAAEERENYPDDVQGLIPRASGRMSAKRLIDGLPIYVPVENLVTP